MTLAFTICSNNYLAHAITLGDSLLQYNPDYIFKIGLVDHKTESINYSTIPFEIVEIESIGMNEINDMLKRYSITELNTAVKPFYFKHFFKNESDIDNIIFLDPDILIYRPFIELEKVLNENEIVITPHFTAPINDDKLQAENDFLNAGLYNLGFIALKKGVESLKLLEWWANRLQNKAHIDFTKGMFTDQLWINFAPLFFRKVLIFSHPGYNMAYWNMHERLINESGQVVKDNLFYPLVFFHFSGFNPLRPDILSKHQDRFSFENRKDIVELFIEYAGLLFRNGFMEYFASPCFYAIEKEKNELAAYLDFKKSIPFIRRIMRGIIVRIYSILGKCLEAYPKWERLN